MLFNYSPQERVRERVLEVQVYHLVLGQTLQIFQLKDQARSFVVFHIRMNLRLASNAHYLNQVEVTHTFAFDVRHEVVEFVQRYGGWERAYIACIV